MPTKDLVLTTSSVARRLRLSENGVRLYHRTGRLTAVRTESGIRLFNAAAVERLARELDQERQGR
jgi:DNA-binding transcriptional MerR regulator